MRFWVLALVFALGLAGWPYLPLPTEGMLARDDPVQRMLQPGEVKQWNYRGEIFHPLAEYVIRGRILSREPYYLDGASRVSPIDFALGWGRMSNPHIYKQLGISQSGRFYSYTWTGDPPLPEDEMTRSSSNNHLIPATPAIYLQCLLMREGDVVALKGYLVQVQFEDGGNWTSSLSRTDTGDHACEIMWVDRAEVVGM